MGHILDQFMNPVNLSSIIQLPQRKLIVSLTDIDLTLKADRDTNNIIFILMIKESRGSAGGRGGGSGMRKIEKILGFKVEQNNDKLIFETNNEADIEKFEIPYSAVAQDIVLNS